MLNVKDRINIEILKHILWPLSLKTWSSPFTSKIKQL